MKHPYLSFVPGWPLWLAVVLFPVALPAQVVFSFTGTANMTALGYSSGNSETFFVTLNDGYAGGALDSFASNQNYWWEDAPPVSPLFTGFSGTGLAGGLTQFSNALSYATISNSESGGISFLYLQMLGAGENLGPTANGTPIYSVDISLGDPGFSFFFPGSPSNPADYFRDFTGSYGTPGIGTIVLFTNPVNVSFNMTSFSILAPIPEPATGAAFFGVAVLGFAAWRRRCRRV